MILKVVALLLLGALIAEATSHCPAAKKKEADECSKETFFVTDVDFSPAKSVGDHDAYCKKQEAKTDCVRKYGKDCLKGFTAQTLTTGLHGVKKAQKMTCKKDGDKKTWMKNTAWLSKEKNAKLKMCVDKGIYNMEFIAANVTQHDQIPQSCCNYWLARKCMTEQLKEIAPDKSTRDYIENYFDTSMTSLINFLCSKQNSVATCKKLMPEAMNRMSGIYAKDSITHTGDSFMITFLEVVVDL